MLISVKAEVNVDGEVELLEPVKLRRKTSAILTLLDDGAAAHGNSEPGNGAAMIKFLKENPLPPSSRRTREEIDKTIEEIRNSWD